MVGEDEEAAAQAGVMGEARCALLASRHYHPCIRLHSRDCGCSLVDCVRTPVGIFTKLGLQSSGQRAWHLLLRIVEVPQCGCIGRICLQKHSTRKSKGDSADASM